MRVAVFIGDPSVCGTKISMGNEDLHGKALPPWGLEFQDPPIESSGRPFRKASEQRNTGARTSYGALAKALNSCRAFLS